MPTILRLPNWIFLHLAKTMLDIDPHARSSMWEDIQIGRKTEIEFLNEAVAKRAEMLGIEAPTNRKISYLIGRLEQGSNVSVDQLY
jgi:2-dehydropantoate 2-reductase